LSQNSHTTCLICLLCCRRILSTLAVLPTYSIRLVCTGDRRTTLHQLTHVSIEHETDLRTSDGENNTWNCWGGWGSHECTRIIFPACPAAHPSLSAVHWLLPVGGGEKNVDEKRPSRMNCKKWYFCYFPFKMKKRLIASRPCNTYESRYCGRGVVVTR